MTSLMIYALAQLDDMSRNLISAISMIIGGIWNPSVTNIGGGLFVTVPVLPVGVQRPS